MSWCYYYITLHLADAFIVMYKFEVVCISIICQQEYKWNLLLATHVNIIIGVNSHCEWVYSGSLLLVLHQLMKTHVHGAC